MRDRTKRRHALVDRLAEATAATLAAVYVGFFAFKVHATPLTIIVCLCLTMMLYVFWKEDKKRRDGGA